MQLLNLTYNSWGVEVLKVLNMMRTTADMCDVTLVLRDSVLQAHSCVLAATSPFFKSLLSGMETLEINLEEFPSNTVIQALNFLYTGTALFPNEDLESLHNVATMLNIPGLVDLTQEMILHSQWRNDKVANTNCAEKSAVVHTQLVADIVEISDNVTQDEKDLEDLDCTGQVEISDAMTQDEHYADSSAFVKLGQVSGIVKTINQDIVLQEVEQEQNSSTATGAQDTDDEQEILTVIVKKEEPQNGYKSPYPDTNTEQNGTHLPQNNDAQYTVKRELDDIQTDDDHEPEDSSDEVDDRTKTRGQHKRNSLLPEIIHMLDQVVPDDGSVPDRAVQTLPQGLWLNVSKTFHPGPGEKPNNPQDHPPDGDDYGVFATLPIQKGTLFGPYQGEIIEDAEIQDSQNRHCWKIYKDSKFSHWLVGEDKSRSNWMCYVQYTHDSTLQNLEAFQNDGKLYFRAYRNIQQFSELLVRYGNKLCTVLGVEKSNVGSQGEQASRGVLVCSECDLIFTSEEVYYRHMHRLHQEGLPLHLYQPKTPDPSQSEPSQSEPSQSEPSQTKPSQGESELKSEVVIQTSTETKHRTRSVTQAKSTETCEEETHKSTSDNQKVKCGRKPKNSENNPLWCSYCGKPFTNVFNLEKHELIHTNERPHKCSVCGRGFTQKANMNAHMKTHGDIKPFICSNCGRSFFRRSELRKHERFHSEDTPHVCGTCGKAFKDVGNLRRHEKCHTEEKPYKCAECGRDFSRVENLRVHMKRHVGEKAHQCVQCGSCFMEKQHLQIHMRRHAGDKPYQCTDCSKSFVDTTSLKSHQRVHLRQSAK